MAYTYDDFLKAANAGGRMNSFSDADLEITKKSPEYGLSMLRLMDDADNATTEEAKLLTQSAMDQLRNTYGGAFTYSGETEYQKLLNEVTNHPSFSYDAATDPTYSAYRKTYLREGDRATENALAKASAMTGGVPSSYAVTAATQAGNYHAAQLADKLPELEQQAYQKYLQDFALKKDKLGVLEADRDNAYSQWLQNYSQNEAKTVAEESAKQQQYDNALALYEILGYATPEIAAILGIPEGTVIPTEKPVETPEPENPTEPPVDPWTDPTYYDNEGLTEAQIKEMQTFFKVDADGLWGGQSKTAAGGKTAKEAWDYYQQVKGDTGSWEKRTGEIYDWLMGYVEGTEKVPAGYDLDRLIEVTSFLTSKEEKEYAREVLRYLMTLPNASPKQNTKPGGQPTSWIVK